MADTFQWMEYQACVYNISSIIFVAIILFILVYFSLRQVVKQFYLYFIQGPIFQPSLLNAFSEELPEEGTSEDTA